MQRVTKSSRLARYNRWGLVCSQLIFNSLSFSQHLWNFHISNKKKLIHLEFHGTSSQYIILNQKQKELFLQNKLMINKLYNPHPRSKKAFSSFQVISEEWLDEFFHFWLKIFAWFFLIVWCKNKENLPAHNCHCAIFNIKCHSAFTHLFYSKCKNLLNLEV